MLTRSRILVPEVVLHGYARLQVAPERPRTTATKVSNCLREPFRHRAARYRADTDLLMLGSSLYWDDLMVTA
jgi:hypothetical protein